MEKYFRLLVARKKNREENERTEMRIFQEVELIIYAGMNSYTMKIIWFHILTWWCWQDMKLYLHIWNDWKVYQFYLLVYWTNLVKYNSRALNTSEEIHLAETRISRHPSTEEQIQFVLARFAINSLVKILEPKNHHLLQNRDYETGEEESLFPSPHSSPHNGFFFSFSSDGSSHLPSTWWKSRGGVAGGGRGYAALCLLGAACSALIQTFGSATKERSIMKTFLRQIWRKWRLCFKKQSYCWIPNILLSNTTKSSPCVSSDMKSGIYFMRNTSQTCNE